MCFSMSKRQYNYTNRNKPCQGCRDASKACIWVPGNSKCKRCSSRVSHCGGPVTTQEAKSSGNTIVTSVGLYSPPTSSMSSPTSPTSISSSPEGYAYTSFGQTSTNFTRYYDDHSAQSPTSAVSSGFQGFGSDQQTRMVQTVRDHYGMQLPLSIAQTSSQYVISNPAQSCLNFQPCTPGVFKNAGAIQFNGEENNFFDSSWSNGQEFDFNNYLGGFPH